MVELLPCKPILHSRDIEEARAFLAPRGVRLDVLGGKREREAFEVRYNGVYLPRLWFGYLRYGAAVSALIHPSRGDYWVHFPLHGRLEIANGWRTQEYDPLHAAVTSPLDAYSLRTGELGARMSLSIGGEALTRHLSEMLGAEVHEPLRLSCTIGLDAGFGRALATLLHAMARDVCVSDALSHPLVASDFEQLIMTSVLLSVPHNHSSALSRLDRGLAPRDVRRAVEFLHANANRPLTLGELVRASGVAGRTLLKHFKDAHGVSPMRYLRNYRLQRVREDLRREPGRSVSEIALRWGFAHLGRFAQQYRQRFGEPPSAARRSARRGVIARPRAR
ncbi:MAG TPA: AraC family transcriptional regulator [Burkholderiales bacterium]|nr:AraC family transcriptional regulator [Burkholderiales bacterium]